jgi:hypothetical protein
LEATFTNTVEGAYDCIVSNFSGAKISAPATLYVSTPCDGIPDWWRLDNFGTTTINDASCATCDPANDWISNLQKYEYGLDPNVSNAVDVLVNGGNVWATNQVVTLDTSGFPFSFIKVSLAPTMANALLLTNTGISLLYTLPSTNNGTYDLFLQYTDAHTNALGPILFKPVTLDTVPPVVQITSPTNGTGNQAFVHLQATVYDPVPTNGFVPDRHHPVYVWINGQQYWQLCGNQIDMPRFPVQPYSNNVITIQALDAAGNQSQATVNWYVAPTSNAPPPSFTVTGFAPNTVVDLPSDPKTWVCGTMNSLYAIVTATINGGSPITMNVHSNQFGYMLPLDWGTNTVLIVASDAGGNASSNTYRLARGNRYQFAMSWDYQDYPPNRVNGSISEWRDQGLPTQTGLVSVVVNGVGTTLTTNGDGTVNFTTVDEVPWPTDGSILMLNAVIQWADGSQDPDGCPDETWITTKQTSSIISSIRTEEDDNFCPPRNPDSATCKLIQGSYSYSGAGPAGGMESSADRELWGWVPNPAEPLDPNQCGWDGSWPDPSQPEPASPPDTGLRVGGYHIFASGLSDVDTCDEQGDSQGFEAVHVPFSALAACRS